MNDEKTKPKIIQICTDKNGVLYALDSEGEIFKRFERVYEADSWVKILNPIK